jgi:hypothetical protein
MEMKWRQCQKLVSFYLAIFLLVIGGSGASAHLMDASDSLSVCNSSDANHADTSVITGRVRDLLKTDIKGANACCLGKLIPGN